MARTPEPLIVTESERTTRSIHAGRSGSLQSGTTIELESALNLIPRVVRPHGAANTSGLSPLPTQIESFAAEIVVGFAIRLLQIKNPPEWRADASVQRGYEGSVSARNVMIPCLVIPSGSLM